MDQARATAHDPSGDPCGDPSGDPDDVPSGDPDDVPSGDDGPTVSVASGDPLEPPPHGPLPVGSGRRAWARRPADEAEAKAIASPLRLRILRVALHEPRTNKEIAARLGKHPATVLHHVRTLVDTGFLIEQPPRRGQRGAREVPYLTSGKSWFLDLADAQLVGGKDLLLETFLSEVRELPPGSLSSTRLAFRLRPDDRDRVVGRLQDLLQEIAGLPSDPEGEPWSVYLGLHPEPGVPGPSE